MLTAERMNCIAVVVLKTDMEDVLEEVARIGVLHPVETEDVGDWAADLAPAEGGRLAQECEARRDKLRALIGDVPPRVPDRARPAPTAIRAAELASVDTAFAAIVARLEPLAAVRERLAARLRELDGVLTQLGSLGPAGLPMVPLLRGTYVSTAMGSVPPQQLGRLQALLAAVPSVVLPFRSTLEETDVVCIVLRRDRAALDAALAEVDFKKMAAPKDLADVSAQARAVSARETGAVKEELAAATRELDKARAAAAPEALGTLERLDMAILLFRIEKRCRLTENTCAFAGWAPEAETESMVSAIATKSHGRAIIEVSSPDAIDKVRTGEIEVPVLFHRPAFLKPFALLVEGFAVPSYGMIDPTVFVAVTFLLMFGMMFGDVGHGLVLLAAGVAMFLKAPKLRDLGKLALYCGASSVAFGFLYGSVFGIEDLFPALWTKPLEGITSMFTAALVFGVGVVSLGIVLNTINALRGHSFWETLFETSGPLAGVVYWAGTGLAVKYLVASGDIRHGRWFLALIGLPLLVIFLQGPLLRLAGKSEKAFPEGIFTYIMEQAIGVMEIFMGYLANTVSFIRVAAFGLAHAGLFVAVFSLADEVAAVPGGDILWWVIVAAGNVVIIVLEGLVVTIQALRLEYYEFFGKFFKGTGSRYEPVGQRDLSWTGQTEG